MIKAVREAKRHSGWISPATEYEQAWAVFIDRVLAGSTEDGRLKLFLIYKGLQARRTHNSLFQQGEYIPLKVTGSFSGSIIAYARKKEQEWALVVVPRFLLHVIQENQLPLGREVWQDTALVLEENAPKSWKDMLTAQDVNGERLMFIGDILRYFPVALLTHTE